MTFLATTRLREFWPDGDPLTLLGLWCLDESELWDANAQRKYRIAPYPWDDRNRFLCAAQYVDGCGERLLVQLADALNTIHGVSHSLRYWRIIVGPWLAWYLEALYDRFVCLRGILDQDPTLVTIGLDGSSFVVPDNFEHFAEIYLWDLYNLQLYTRVLEALRVSMLRKPAAISERLDAADGLARWMQRSKGATRAAIHRLQESWVRHSRVAIVGTAVPKIDRLRLWASSGGRVGFCTRFPQKSGPPMPPDSQLRGRLAAQLSGANEFEAIAASMVAADMPLAYLERFRQQAEQTADRVVPKVILSAVGWCMDDRFKFFAAEALGRGSRLLSTQHGGYYGMLAAHSPECHEERIADVFYSWGWRSGLADGRTVQPMPGLPLARVRSRRRVSSPRREIVLVTTMHPRYLYRFQSHPVGPQWARYVEWQHRFVAGLSSDVRQDLVVRLYPWMYGWGNERAWRRAFPDVRLERSSPPISEKFNSAALLVIDHPGTTVLEAMAAGVPQVLFWDPELFTMRSAVGDAIDDLQRADILFTSPERAAEKVALVVERADDWWQSPDVARTAAAFRARFAWTAPDWRKTWRRELLKQRQE